VCDVSRQYVGTRQTDDPKMVRLWNWLRTNKRAPLTSYQARIVFDYVDRMIRDMAPKEGV
jgi:hypothetical protein